jgi:hypothetical protein
MSVSQGNPPIGCSVWSALTPNGIQGQWVAGRFLSLSFHFSEPRLPTGCASARDKLRSFCNWTAGCSSATSLTGDRSQTSASDQCSQASCACRWVFLHVFATHGVGYRRHADFTLLPQARPLFTFSSNSCTPLYCRLFLALFGRVGGKNDGLDERYTISFS